MEVKDAIQSVGVLQSARCPSSQLLILAGGPRAAQGRLPWEKLSWPMCYYVDGTCAAESSSTLAESAAAGDAQTSTDRVTGKHEREDKAATVCQRKHAQAAHALFMWEHATAHDATTQMAWTLHYAQGAAPQGWAPPSMGMMRGAHSRQER